MANEIKEITVWDGFKHRDVIGKVMTADGMKDFYRPTLSFIDDNKTQSGFIKTDSTASFSNGKMLIPTLYKYDVYSSKVYLDDNFNDGNRSDLWTLEK